MRRLASRIRTATYWVGAWIVVLQWENQERMEQRIRELHQQRRAKR